MSSHLADVEGCLAAHGRLRAVVVGLSEADLIGPSLLPGWSVGHLLTHLAQNADAMSRRIAAAERNEVVDQYPGGASGRASAIESGARRRAAEILDHAIRSSEELDRRFASLDDDVWGRPVRTVAGADHLVADLPFRRWREVEVHLVDIGGRASPSDWSEELVDRALPRLLASLPERSDRRVLMAWLLGRGPAPELEPWG